MYVTKIFHLALVGNDDTNLKKLCPHERKHLRILEMTRQTSNILCLSIHIMDLFDGTNMLY